MKIGTSKQQRKDQESLGGIMENMIELKEKTIIRLVQGPQLTKVVFVPVFKLDEETEEFKPSWTVLRFKDSAGLLDSLYETEQGIRRDLGEEKPDCGFKPSAQWIYLGYDALDQTQTKLRAAKIPKGVKDEINRKETELDPADPSFLMNGFYFLYDSLITKGRKKDKKGKPIAGNFGIEYKHDIYGQNPWAGRIPAAWLNEDMSNIMEELGGIESIFPEWTHEMIKSCDIDLETVLKPMSEAQIQEELLKHPINLGFIVENTQRPKYPQTKSFIDALESVGIQVLSSEKAEPKKSVVAGGFQLKDTTKAEEKPEEKTEEKVEVVQEETQEKVEVAKTVSEETPKKLGSKSLSGLKIKK